MIVLNLKCKNKFELNSVSGYVNSKLPITDLLDSF